MPYFFTYKPSDFSVFDAKVWEIFHKKRGLAYSRGFGIQKQVQIYEDFRYMKIRIFALRWKDEFKRSSQLRTLLKRVVVNRA